MSTGSRILSFAAIAVLLAPPPLKGQEQRPMYELPTITITALSDTDPLHEKAMMLYEQAKWEEAAVLHREAAESMPENDPNSYTQYDRSARLYFYAGDFTTSRNMMERAAEVAEATGDIVSAAYRHVDAAFIAVWEGYPGKRREHVQVAEEYATSANFQGEDSSRIYALTRGVGMLPMEEGEE